MKTLWWSSFQGQLLEGGPWVQKSAHCSAGEVLGRPNPPPQMSARPAKQRACPRHAHHSNGTAEVQHPVLQREVEPEIEVKLGALEVVLALDSSMPGGDRSRGVSPAPPLSGWESLQFCTTKIISPPPQHFSRVKCSG